MIELRSVKKVYDKKCVLDIDDLKIEYGKILGIVGDNGAGKTTLLRLISRIENPTEGELDYDDENMIISALIEKPALDEELTAFDNLKYVSILCGHKDNKRIDELLEIVGLSDDRNMKVKKFSLGMKQRLGIGMALIGKPDFLILDEFIPQPWERISKKEGEQIMDLYKTIARDREIRGREPLKLLALANAVSISNPLCNILEITDIIADMQARGRDMVIIDGIMIRILQDAGFHEEEEKSLIYKRMAKTAWGQMALENKFAYDDLSNIGSISIKGYRCICKIKYKTDEWYVYRKGKSYYVSFSQSTKYKKEYDLSLENDQKLFNIECRLDIRDSCIDHKATFQSFTMYDVIINYMKYFKL